MIHGEYLPYTAAEIMSDNMELSYAETVNEFLMEFSMSLDRIRDIKRFVSIASTQQLNGNHVIMRRQDGDYLPACVSSHKLMVSCFDMKRHEIPGAKTL